jgi:LuxR family transcriptional regulator, quorum-sensing system regulator BjaR1
MPHDVTYAAIMSSDSIPELSSRLQSMIAEFGFQGFAFIDLTSLAKDQVRAFSSMPEWEAVYRAANFIRIDPCIARARVSTAPFTWDKLLPETQFAKNITAVQKLMFAAHLRGYTNGYVFPYHNTTSDGVNQSAVISLMWSGEPSAIHDVLKSSKRFALQICLLNAAECALTLYSKQPSSYEVSGFSEVSHVGLTMRETEALTWAARGFTAVDTGIVLGIVEETVQTHIRNAATKLQATNKTHAVARAIQQGRIDP